MKNSKSLPTIDQKLGRTRFETMLRGVLPSAAGGAGELFDTCASALRSANFTPPSIAFLADARPADMFLAMREKVGVVLGPSILAVIAKTIVVAVAGGVAALLLAELLGIAIGWACILVAIVGLLWWTGSVRSLFDHLASVLKSELVDPILSFGR